MKTRDRQRIFVGDVQGCCRELDDLLDALAYDPRQHELWFVGDLVNRGPDNVGVLRRVRELDANSVLGNHDLHLLATVAGHRRSRGRDTLDDVLDAEDRVELLDWLRRRPLVAEWDDLWLVHAGLHPEWTDPRATVSPIEAALARGDLPLDDPVLRFATTVRRCDASGALPDANADEPPRFLPWNEHYQGRRMVVCGHWSVRGLVQAERLRSLDTGCVWGGSLTAWNAETDEIVQVPARAQHAQP